MVSSLVEDIPLGWATPAERGAIIYALRALRKGEHHRACAVLEKEDRAQTLACTILAMVQIYRTGLADGRRQARLEMASEQ